MARVGGRTETFELVYLDETSRGFARLPRFERIRPTDLQGEYVLYFLFHLPPGVQPQRFHTGRQDVDLTALNLIAPP
jgi:hypothetical protein